MQGVPAVGVVDLQVAVGIESDVGGWLADRLSVSHGLDLVHRQLVRVYQSRSRARRLEHQHLAGPPVIEALLPGWERNICLL